MAKKGQTFQLYTEDFKEEAVQRYEKGEESYRVIAADLGLRSSTQLKQWVRKYKKGEAFDLRGKGQGSKGKIHSKALKELGVSRLKKNETT
jgi:transposase